MTLCSRRLPLVTRREMLRHTACGFGFLAFAALASESAARAADSNNPLAPKKPPLTPRAKRVIFLFQGGGPPHMDTFDPKPLLNAENNGKPVSDFASILGPEFKDRKSQLVGTPWKFARHGKSGLSVSDVFPFLAKQADELCLIRSMYSDFNGHPEAALQLHTGQGVQTRPSLGTWTTYGLGTENADLPGFVTLGLKQQRHAQTAFMPAVFGGTNVEFFRNTGTLRYLENKELSRPLQKQQLDLVQDLNRDLLERTQRDAQVDDVIRNCELAFRMQAAMPGVLDIQKEPKSILEMYGVGDKALAQYRMPEKCLLARRLIQAGVRFVEVECASNDAHNNLKKGYGDAAFHNDQPVAALLADLKQQGLLKDTLVVCGGEFGRTPYCVRPELDGREHNNTAFTVWLAGGGVKSGFTYGKTDELGANVVENRVDVADLHATILHLLGLNHEELTYPYAGRNFRLTDTKGKIVRDVLA